MSDSLGAILIETAIGDFDLSVESPPGVFTLTVPLAEKHMTPPIVTIQPQQGIGASDEVSQYSVFINDVSLISPFTYSVIVGISGSDFAMHADNAPLIQIHAMSYR